MHPIFTYSSMSDNGVLSVNAACFLFGEVRFLKTYFVYQSTKDVLFGKYRCLAVDDNGMSLICLYMTLLSLTTSGLMTGLYNGRELHFFIPSFVMTTLHLPCSVIYCACTSLLTSLRIVCASLKETTAITNGSSLLNVVLSRLTTNS